MKKIISSILIAIVILQIFAPFSVGWEDKKVEINVNKANAEADGVDFSRTLYISEDSITGSVKSKVTEESRASVLNTYSDLSLTNTINGNGTKININNEQYNLKKYDFDSVPFKFENLKANTTYKITTKIEGVKNGKTEIIKSLTSNIITPVVDGDSYTKKESTDGSSEEANSSATGINWANLHNWEQPLWESANKSCITGATKLNEFCFSAEARGISGRGLLSIVAIGIDRTTDLYSTNIKITDETGAIVPDTNKILTYSIDGDKYNDMRSNADLKNEAEYDSYLFRVDPINGLIKGKTYNITITIKKEESTETQTLGSFKLPEDSVTETKSGTSTVAVSEDSGSLPACGLDIGITMVGNSKGTFVGCIAQGLYYIFFRTTSFVFEFAGRVLDFSLFYSISDTSYRSAFVVEGWGIVRDFCNMFFIFILLYVAIGTILNLHSVKTKEMIMNVVIIGILMNFSLFATQVIIDASNILARVFYNTNTIVTGKSVDNGTGDNIIKSELGKFGEIQLSGAIVSKVDPQQLIIRANEVSHIPQKGVEDDDVDTSNGLSAGSFIIVVFLSTFVNIVGIIAFLSCAIIFITRVIGLWLAMILVPVAFFSYTVPALQGIKMVGWTHWWPDTLKLAFLAPVFAFFMYIIVGFMDKGLGIVDILFKQELSGMNFLVSIIVPFVFIMVLLLKAKSIANDMSGEIGQSITSGIKTIGGLALGAAAGGVALAGRSIIGKGMAKMSTGDSANHLATQKFAYSQDLDKWKAGGKKGPKPVYNAPKAGDVIGQDKNGKDITYKKNPFTYLGGKLNEKQMKVGGVDHARHEEDEVMKASGLEGRDRATLSGQEIKTMEGKHKQLKGGDAEAAARKGVDAKGKTVLLKEKDPVTGAVLNSYQGEEDFKAKKRKEVINDVSTRTGASRDGDVDASGKLTDSGKKKVENELNIKLTALVKDAAADKLSGDFEHMRTEANKNVNPLTRSFAGANKNSYDLRKLSEMKTDRREGLLTKGTVGLVAAVAAGVRGGIKGVGMSNGGVKIEGDFLKDLGSTITDSLKSMKVNVDLSHVGEHKSSADAHGGGGHH